MSHFSRSAMMTKFLQGEAIGAILENFHRFIPEATRDGRNMMAGYMRGWGICYKTLTDFIRKDPIYRESLYLASGRTIVNENNLMNLFLIMKYGMKGFSGDFVEFGSYGGGSALFIANNARRLGFTGKVYALDTFQGMPSTDDLIDFHQQGDFADTDIDRLVKYASEVGLNNLVFVQGLFEETLPDLLKKVSSIALAHIDCDIYSAVKYAITSINPFMEKAGGYLVLDDPLVPACLGALQAVEEVLQKRGFRAEQVYPHLVYRMPKVGSLPNSREISEKVTLVS